MLAACAVTIFVAWLDMCETCPTLPEPVVIEALARTSETMRKGGVCLRFEPVDGAVIVALMPTFHKDRTPLGFEYQDDKGKSHGVVTLHAPRIREIAETDAEVSAAMSLVLTHELLHHLGCTHTDHGILRATRPVEDLTRPYVEEDSLDVGECVRSLEAR